MKRGVLFCLWSVVLFGGLPAGGETPNAQSAVGINLGGISYYATELAFVDIFKQSKVWVSQAEGKGWDQGGPLALTADGWVKRLRPDQWADTLLCTVGGHYPAGEYVCLYEGEGRLTFRFDAKVKQKERGRVVLEVAEPKEGILVSIKATNPENPIRDIRVIMPGFEKTYGQQPFHPAFLKRWEAFKVIRFMDWMRTNGSTIAAWSDRPTTTIPTQGQKGVALEYMIQLANTLHCDPWFCLPHLATDDYVRRFAEMVKERLDPARRVYVEYTNEAWNGIFQQARYCREKGRALKLSDNDYQAQLFYYSKRSVEIFRIWEAVFGGTERLVRVLAAQSANPWTGVQVMDFQEAYKQADVLGVAPYFGNSLGNPKRQEETSGWSVERVLESCREAIAKNKTTTQRNAREAKQRGLALITYEGGQHLVGHGGAENNQALETLFHAANRDPRMKDLYWQDLANWKEAGGTLFTVFSSMGRYSKWGSWGVLEYHDQDPRTAPKYQAIREFISQNPRWW